ncbi:GNAT family N-acetyltransferase [Salmonella enterica]|nr:GNAT family N-acetyltransferase [Salmonella enterica]
MDVRQRATHKERSRQNLPRRDDGAGCAEVEENGNVLGGAGVWKGDVPRQQVAIIYDVGLSTLYRKFPAGYR